MNLKEEDIKNLNENELMKYIEEQKKLPRNTSNILKRILPIILGIGERTLRRKINDYRNEEKVIEQLNIFTEEEIKVLKEIVKNNMKVTSFNQMIFN